MTILAGERDAQLAEKLRSECGSILQWAIEGCLAWQSEGLNAPTAVRDATEAYLSAEDSLALWLDECCVLNERCWTAASALFVSWRDWTEKNHEHTGSQKRFSENLESRGFTPQRTRSARGFLGLGLVTDVTG